VARHLHNFTLDTCSGAGFIDWCDRVRIATTHCRGERGGAMDGDSSPPVPEGWTVVEFDENDDYRAWCSEESPDETPEGDDGAR
jgi:hypothetical protein